MSTDLNSRRTFNEIQQTFYKHRKKFRILPLKKMSKEFIEYMPNGKNLTYFKQTYKLNKYIFRPKVDR